MEQSYVVQPEKGEEIYLDSFPLLLDTDTFFLTKHHRPDLAYSAMATQLPGTCAVFSPRLYMTCSLCSAPPCPLRSRLWIWHGFRKVSHQLLTLSARAAKVSGLKYQYSCLETITFLSPGDSRAIWMRYCFVRMLASPASTTPCRSTTEVRGAAAPASPA